MESARGGIWTKMETLSNQYFPSLFLNCSTSFRRFKRVSRLQCCVSVVVGSRLAVSEIWKQRNKEEIKLIVILSVKELRKWQ